MCFFRGERDTRYTLCARYTLYAVAAYVVAKLQLVVDFLRNILPRTPSEKGHEVRGPRDLPKYVFQTGENSPPPMKIAGEISKKEKNEVFWHEYLTLLKQKISTFFSRSFSEIDPSLSFIKKIFRNFRFLS